MKITLNKIENDTVFVFPGNTINVTILVPTEYSQATEGVYLIYDPFTGNNEQANTLTEMKILYNQLSNTIAEYQDSSYRGLDFYHDPFTNGFPYVNDNSVYPLALEIV